MKIRPKLSGAPLAYTLAMVEGSSEPHAAFAAALWAEGTVGARLKELVFLRSSVLNECHT